MLRWKGHFPRMKKENRSRAWSDVILTFDIETTSLFEFSDGWRCWRPRVSQEEYSVIRKAAVPYIWQMGIETNEGFVAMYGRDFYEFGDVLEKLARKKKKHIIWVHNLGWEMAFLMDIFIDRKWTIEKVLARSPRHPIKFFIKELQIEFRCSYLLTGLPLSKAAKEYAKTARKLENGLKYTVPRSPLTKLTETELKYCEMDVIALCEIIEHYRELYRNLYRVPYTLTGELRKELKARLPYGEKLWIARHTPKLPVFMLLNAAFAGGIARANYYHAGEILQDIYSFDMASSYPTVLCAYKYPVNSWFYVDSETAECLDKEEFGVLFHVKLYGLRSVTFNRYIMRSKALNTLNIETTSYDNGRIISAA